MPKISISYHYHVPSFGQSSFLVRKQCTMVANTPIHTTTSIAVMTAPNVRRPLLSNISPMTCVAVTYGKATLVDIR